MSGVKKILNIHSGPKKIFQWIADFEEFCLTSPDVNSDNVCAHFLVLLGREGYSLIKALACPKTPATSTYTELRNALLRHLCPDYYQFQNNLMSSEQLVNKDCLKYASECSITCNNEEDILIYNEDIQIEEVKTVSEFCADEELIHVTTTTVQIQADGNISSSKESSNDCDIQDYESTIQDGGVLNSFQSNACSMKMCCHIHFTSDCSDNLITSYAVDNINSISSCGIRLHLFKFIFQILTLQTLYYIHCLITDKFQWYKRSIKCKIKLNAKINNSKCGIIIGIT